MNLAALFIPHLSYLIPHTSYFSFHTSSLNSSYPEGDALDQFPPEAVLETLEDLFAAVTDDFVQPHAVVDGDEQGALVDPGRPRVRRENGIDEIVPDVDDLGLGLA